MGTLESSLAPEENLLLHRHPHWKTLIKPILIGVFATAAATALYVIYSWEGLIPALAVGIPWAVIMVWFVIAPLIRWGATHFGVTDRRIMFRTGVFNKTGIDIPIARINSVQFRHDLVDRMFRTGTLIVESASDEPLEFSDIPQVERVHALLYDELNNELSHDDK